MLTMHTATSSAAVKKYFEMADYYSDGQETIGLWGGKLGDRLSLYGPVDKLSFDLLCDNKNPATGTSLTPRTNDNRRVGYDLVFSGPKSFSIVQAFASDTERETLANAFNASVRETMEECEADMQVRVRKGGAFHDRPTRSLVWAEFDHSTARPVDGQVPDMHWHKHVFCFNATYDPVEQRIKAGEFSYLKRDGEYYTAAFYSRLAGKLEDLGYGIERLGGKKWEIAGIPQAMIERFSKRTGEVEAEAERLGLEAGKLKAELGAKTRSGKQKELTQDELRDAWWAQLNDADRDALARVYGQGIAPDPQVTAGQAVAFAIDHLSEQQSAFAERELLRVALLHGLGDVAAEEIVAELPRHGVVTGEVGGRMMATTNRLQDEERYIARMAGRGLGAASPVGLSDALERGKLNDGQWRVVTGLLQSSSRVNLVEGPAGAGKSTMLATYDRGMKLAGESATYLATTVKAAEVLAEAGFAVKTVAHFLLDERMQSKAFGGRVVVDESSMLGHKDAVKLFKIAEEKHLKLVFVGDPMQHGSVNRGTFLRTLKEQGMVKPFRLTEIMRQQDAEYRAAAVMLSQGRSLDGFNALDKKEWVQEIAEDETRYQAMAGEYLQAVDDGATCLVVSPTHAEAAQITAEIRTHLREAGKLGAEDKAFTRLVAVNASEAERGQATTYRPGDVLCFHQNAKGGHIKGKRMTVTDPAQVPVSEARHFMLYRTEKTSLATGDKIRFTGNVKDYQGEHTYKNGHTHTVKAFTPGGNIRLDDDRVIKADAGLWRHGFVETSFGAQGQTVQRVILGMSSDSLGATNQEQMYVSATRAKEKLSLYTDSKDLVKQAIQRSSQKAAALDVQPKPPEPKRSRLRDDHLERQRRIAAGKRPRSMRHSPPAAPQPTRPRPMIGRPLPPVYCERMIVDEQERQVQRGR